MRVARWLLALVLGSMCALTPPTSVISLGWLMRMMRARAIGGEPRPGWIMGAPGSGALARAFGGLWANIRTGVAAAVAIFIATFPFAVFWLVSWWAGWENSFNKGYEQAFIGPLVGLSGVGVFAIIMVFLPIALAHQAVEARAWSLFQLRRVRAAVAHTGWGYLFWTLAMLLAALPLFGARSLPVFAEGIYPGIADMDVDQIAGIRLVIRVLNAGYVFAAALLLKRWLARIYARAASRAAARDADLWQGAAIGPDTTDKRPIAPLRWLQTALLLGMWTGFATLIFVGQFLNHSWWLWLNHPLIFLPWAL